MKLIKEDCSVKRQATKKVLKEGVPDEAYAVAQYIIDMLARLHYSKKIVNRAMFDDLFSDALQTELNINSDAEEICGESANDFESDVRGILSYQGWATIFEGENEGGLSLTESKNTKKSPARRTLKEG